jgi:Holliday junction resolvasome RuvABC endonuclease subunit
MKQGGVLALDLARNTGWCLGPPFGHPETGTWPLPNLGGWVARAAALEKALGDFLAKWRPEQMVLETPLPPQAATSNLAHRSQYSLDTVAWLSGYWASVPVSAIDTYTVRREVLGQGQFSKDEAKRAVMHHVRKSGIKAHNHDEADAALLWLWHDQQLRLAPDRLAMRH